MKEIDRRLRVSDQVIRHLTVRVDEENRIIDRTRTLRKEDSRRRRIARGLPPERQPGEGPQRQEDDDDRFGVEADEAALRVPGSKFRFHVRELGTGTWNLEPEPEPTGR